MLTQISDPGIERLDLVGDAENGDDGGEGGGHELAVGGGLLLGHVEHGGHPGHPPGERLADAGAGISGGLAAAGARHRSSRWWQGLMKGERKIGALY